jgi:hypothetical protein
MSEINAIIVVEPFDINITLDQPGITVTPNVTSLNIYAVGGTNGVPAGNVGDLQYYAANGFAAIPSNTANYTGNTLNLNVTETKISGGVNGYFLQTDGTGNIDWAPAGNGGGGNGIPGGANTQIQYNDTGAFGGNSGFTFNEVSGNVAIPGALVVTGNISGTNANFSGNINAVTVTANLNGSATVAGTVTNNAQPNITSFGTLSNLSVAGAITGIDITANTGVFTGNAAGLTNIPGANVTGTVTSAGFATTAGSATTAGTVTTAAQPNITSVGTLTSLAVTGNTISGNVYANSGTIGATLLTGTLTTGPQPNITSLGFLANLTVAVFRTTDTEIALGLDAGLTSQDTYAIAIGTNAGEFAQGANAVAIGYNAGRDNQGDYSIAFGQSSGNNFQGNNAIAIGQNAGANGQGANTIAIGTNAAPNVQPNNTIVINATGSNLSASVANSLFVKPMRSATNPNAVVYYNDTTGEVTYGLPTFGNTSVTGTLSIQQAKEKVNVSNVAATGVINYDLLTSAIVFNTANASANFTLNFRGNSAVTLNTVLDSNQSMTCSFINTNGVTPYLPTQLQIDGANIVPLWTGSTGGPAPGTPVGKDMYVFNILKTAANTYSVFASRTGYA